MLSNIALLRYVVYIAMAVLFSAFCNKYMPECTFINPSFLILCGILGEILGWKYNDPEPTEEN